MDGYSGVRPRRRGCRSAAPFPRSSVAVPVAHGVSGRRCVRRRGLFRRCTLAAARDAQGATCKATGWHRVTAWGRLAEVVNQYMATGKRVRVIGRLEYQSWTDKETGLPRSRAVIVASQVLFLDYDRAHAGLVEAPEAEEPALAAVAEAEAEQPKPNRRQQAA